MNQKAKKFIDKIIQKAIKERDTKGYRENLGYDQENKVRNLLDNKLSLTYADRANLIDYFYSECDKI